MNIKENNFQLQVMLVVKYKNVELLIINNKYYYLLIIKTTMKTEIVWILIIITIKKKLDKVRKHFEISKQ